MEDFVGSLIGGENMLGLTDAMSCVTEILNFVTGNTTLACLAFGFVVARGGIRVLKKLAHIGG